MNMFVQFQRLMDSDGEGFVLTVALLSVVAAVVLVLSL